MSGMTCEDTPTRLTWEIQLHEPVSGVWICKAYGRATTTAQPEDIARAVLAGYLAASPPVYKECLRALARPDGGLEVTVTPAELGPDAVTTDPAVRAALPLYLQDALA
jgi:hypothetical protein